MIQKFKKPVSILLSLIMVFSVFAAVPMTVNAAPPGGGGIGLTGHTLTLYANNGTNESYSHTEIAGNMMIGTPTSYGFTTPENKEFSCWNTQANGGGTDYTAFSNYSYNEDLTLYAQWVSAAPAPTATVTFGKVTDVSQITADNIGECTFAEAKAWVLNNWNDITVGVGAKSVMFAYTVDGVLHMFYFDPIIGIDGFDEDCNQGNAYSLDSIKTLYGAYALYLCGFEPSASEPAAVTFGKVTDESQISADNIAECTFDDAKAWVLNNWNDVTDGVGWNTVVFAYYDNGALKTFGFSPDETDANEFEADFNEAGPNDLGNIKLLYGYDLVIYLCGLGESGTEPTTYTITDASVNGTVTASVNGTDVTEAEENADVLLTVAPAEGYQFVSISAGDVSLTTVTEGSQYSFTMPNKPVTVTAVFEEIPAPAHTHDGITFDAWEHTDSLPTEAGNYYLTADVAISATWTVPAGETKLCLNGHTLSYTGSNGSVIQLNNADQKLTVYDCGTTGAITGGNTTGNGGGVQITAGTFELKNGSIEGNIADNGGGVSLQNSGNFIMSGGTIRYNCGYGNTGGVLVLNNNFTMTGGSIQYNVGKVFGGIGIASSQPNMSGTPVVEGNVFFSDTTRTNTKITKTDSGYTLASGGTPSDIRHATANGLKINIVGALENGAQIGIFNNSQTAAFTNGYKTHNPDDDAANYFFSNDSNRFIMRDTAKEAMLGGYFTVTWKGADGTVLETDENVVTGTTPEFNGTIPEKPEDDEATYTALWTPDIVPVTGDATYTVYYRPTTKRLYKVYIQCTAYNWLNMTVDKTSLWSTFNGSPIYNGTGYSLHHIQITSGADVMTASGNMITVKKQGTASFRGFVNGSQFLNFNLTATPYYTVTWENYDGTELQTGLVLGGTTPVYNGAEPEKETADGTAYYPFLGWSPEVETATADTTYTAVFSDTAVPYQHTHDGIKFKEWTNTDSLPKYASNYCLTSDVTTSATWTVPAGEMNLCLNGHKIDANGGNYAVITIGNGRTLNLYDPEGGGVITGANHTAEAGGVMVSNGGHFNMYGGSIEGNRSTNGGGVSANGSNAVFHMYGGSIQYNEGYDNTGGILLQGNTTFTMSGGSIQHNTGKNYGGIGTYQATMIFDGDVNISDNYIYSGGTSGKITKSGDTYTLDTTDGTPCNVKTAHANDRIKVTGQLTLTHKIGIIRQGTKGVFTTGYTTSGNTADPSEYFYSDDPNYTVGLSNGEAAIVDQYTVTWNNWDNSNLETDTRVAVGATPSYNGATPQKPDDATNYYTFSGWDPEVSAVTGDETYTAQFTATAKPEVIKDCNNKYGNFRLYSNVPIVQFSNSEALLTGAIIPITYGDNNSMIPLVDAKGYSYKLYDQTGTEIPAQITSSSSAPGSNYEFSDDVTVYTNVINFTRPADCNALYIVATEPAPAEFAPKHSVSVNGDVALNYYLNPDIVKAGDTINFTWTVNGVEKSDSYTLKASDDKPEGFMATVNVPAAEMTYDITASYGDYTDTFSVRRYCDVILSDEYETAYTTAHGAEAYAKLENLVLNMLDYGAKAQTAFGRTEVDLANKDVEFSANVDRTVTGAMIDAAIAAAPVNAGKTSGDPAAVAETLGVKYYTTSLMFLTESTLRHIFTPATYPGEWGYGDLDGNQNSYYYYVQRENIPAAELDTLWTFEVGGQSFNYSALDYCKAILNSEMDGKYKDLAASTYWYNQAANALFDEPAPAPVENVVDLSTLTGAYEAQDGDVLTGELQGDYQITIADDATVTLRDVTITCLTVEAEFAGITPLGDATIILEGTNVVKGGFSDGFADFPGILAPEGYTLTIDGTGSLTASKGDDDGDGGGCGIGGGYGKNAGDIEIKGGNITAIDGYVAAGIGGGYGASCGDITITGGTVNATGGDGASGIGSGYSGSCGDITITGGTVNATGGYNGAGIGSGYYGSCGAITINGGTVNATGGDFSAGIGSGYYAICGAITINGGTVIATGGQDGAGIGSGANGASCGNITIADTVTQVTATAGEGAPNSIGAGDGGTCGTISIADPSKVTQN